MKNILIVILVAAVAIFVYLQFKKEENTKTSPNPILAEQTTNTPANSPNTIPEWITTDFKNIYAVNISYPKNWTLNCCGDTEAGTFHDLYYEPKDGSRSQHIQLNETFGFSDNIEGPIIDPQTYYKNNLASGKLKRIDNLTTTNLGASLLAFSEESAIYDVPPTLSKTYIFQVPDGRSGNPLYYIVRFSSLNEFSEEFIQTFLNRLTLAR